MLDFVPNHTAPDHPWVQEHPEYYIAGTESDLAQAPQNYTRVSMTPDRRYGIHQTKVSEALAKGSLA